MANHKTKEIGFDEIGMQVAETYECTDINCNCMGGWTDGEPERAIIWKTPEDLEHEQELLENEERVAYFKEQQKINPTLPRKRKIK